MENAAIYEDGLTVKLQLLNLSNDDCFYVVYWAGL